MALLPSAKNQTHLTAHAWERGCTALMRLGVGWVAPKEPRASEQDVISKPET